MTQFMAAVSARLSDGGQRPSGAPDRGALHEGGFVPGGKKISCPGGGLSVVTGQLQKDLVGSAGDTTQDAFRQLTTCAVPGAHVSGVRGNWAYEKFDISEDVVVIWPDCGALKMDSPLSTTLHWQVADSGPVEIQSAIVHKEYGPLHRTYF